MKTNIFQLPHRCNTARRETEINGFLISVKLSNNYYTRLYFELQNIFNQFKLYVILTVHRR